jgi:cell division protein FtsI (penicillin-binding protein 3)
MTRPFHAPVRHDFRRRLLLAGWVLCGLAIVGRAVMVQVFQGPHWQKMAEAQHRETVEVPAPRGFILDRNGNTLAATHERFSVGVAPWELRSRTRQEVVARLAKELSLDARRTRLIADSTAPWQTVPGRFPAQVAEGLRGINGVHVSRELERFYPRTTLAQGVLGRVQDGAGAGGIEGLFDEHLRGIPGKEVKSRDSARNPLPGQSILVTPPVPGGTVVLTLDRDLQEIAQEALMAAIRTTGARGGDLIVSNPHTGEILSLVSVVEGNAWGLSAINAPYEPGSTLKPFTVAGALLHQVATLSDSVDGENGRWRAPGRILTDVHPSGPMTVAGALRVSSNIGVAKVAQGLTSRHQFEILRDFGFGTYTGIELRGEASGSLPHPRDWTLPTPIALAIGYEINVTPLQMVMAYGALANGGRLMEPRLVRELRDPQGRTVFRSEPRAVRQVLPPSLAQELTQVLVDVVAEGTGTQAQMASFKVAGKSGTSRAHDGRGYTDEYFASFVSYFPVEKPQLVVFVKLDRPQGAYYGGATAAPVTRATMEAVLAARQAPIDREALASLTRQQPRTSPLPGAQFTSSNPSSSSPVRALRTPIQPEASVFVPDVSGLFPRDAVRRLHALGLRVLLEAPGTVIGTRPPTGTPLVPGDTVRVLSRGHSNG